MNWNISDIAICVITGNLYGSTNNNNPPPLRKNAEYVVQNIYQCPKCKETSLDVGLVSTYKNGTFCCSERIPCHDIHWCSSARFVKKDTKNIEEQISQAIKEENYELAEILTKKK